MSRKRTLESDVRAFLRHIETVRGLLMGTPIGNSAVLAIAWFGAITVASFFAGMMIDRLKSFLRSAM